MSSTTAKRALELGSGQLSLGTYLDVVESHEAVVLSAQARSHMLSSCQSLHRQLESGRRIYGVNTGFGADSTTSLPRDLIAVVQRNTLTSHSVGTGAALSSALVRGMLLLKANVLAQGYSGIRPDVVDALLALLKHNILPVIPEQGSLAASGDLVPCGHLGQALIGEGPVLYEGQVTTATAALEAAGLRPLVVEEKEGLALVNGTTFTTAYAIQNVVAAERLLRTADIAASVSLQALRGWITAFDQRMIAVRPFPGAAVVAANIRRLCAESPLMRGEPTRVHDPYCLRCVPQVHGASRDAFAYVQGAVLVELNAVTDNPLIFPEDECLSGGNFHAQPIGIPMDTLAVLVSELGSISQRRTQHLVSPVYDVGLPPKLSPNPLLGSGLFMLNTTAAALASENKTLCFPASVDSMAVDTVEDHVSMGSVAARKAAQVIINTSRIMALELICGCQALDFQLPLHASQPVQRLHAFVRQLVPFLETDRGLSKEIELVADRVLRGDLLEVVNGALDKPLD